MEEWRKRGADRLEQTGYLPVLRDLARSLTAPFWWHEPGAPIGTAILHNGTICFVDTGSGLLGITADHVFQQYLRDKQASPSVICQLGGSTFEPEARLVSSSAKLDLASFSVPEVLINASGANVHRATAWPPDALQEGELVLLGGFPGPLRIERPGTADYLFASFIARVHQSSEDHIAVHLNVGGSYSPQGIGLSAHPDLGGSSGGPVFRVHSSESQGAIDRLELAGFIYEYSAGFELLFARHAARIDATGRVTAP